MGREGGQTMGQHWRGGTGRDKALDPQLLFWGEQRWLGATVKWPCSAMRVDINGGKKGLINGCRLSR